MFSVEEVETVEFEVGGSRVSRRVSLSIECDFLNGATVEVTLESVCFNFFGSE